MSSLVDVANALATLIDNAELTPDPIVLRSYIPDFDRKKDPTTIFILPLGSEVKEGTRDRDLIDYKFQIAIYSRVESSEATEIDALIQYVETILDLIRLNRSVGNARLTSVGNDVAYDFASLNESRLFVSVINCSYELLR